MGQTQPGGRGVTGLSRLTLTVTRGMTLTDSQAASEIGLTVDRASVRNTFSAQFSRHNDVLCVCPVSWLIWLLNQEGINHLYPVEGSSGSLWMVQVPALVMEERHPWEESKSVPFSPSHEREKWPNPSTKSSEVRWLPPWK